MKENILFTTNRPRAIFHKGKGCYLYDKKGEAYLDFIGGWGANVLGHCPVAITKAIKEQSEKLLNCSPAFYNEEMIKLAGLLRRISGFNKIFFCSSGLEANESALKLCRKHASLYKNGAYEIVSLKNSFHGRSLALMSVSGKENWDKLFQPKIEGVRHCEINNLADFKKKITNQTSAVFLELIQGEGGVNVLEKNFLKEIRRITKKKKILLVIDEVQTGIGRTGQMFAFEHFKVKPDILTLAKGLGGGLPLAAMLTTREFDLFEAGENGSTFSGQPFICRVSRAVLEEVIKKDLVGNAKEMGEFIKKELLLLKNKKIKIEQIRGLGLLLAFDLEKISALDLAKECFKNKLIINAVNKKSIRLIPPLTITKKNVKEFIAIFCKSYLALSK